MEISRRQFLQVAAVSSLSRLSSGADVKLPRRALGRTGEQVSLLAFGAGSRFMMYEEEDEALAALNEAIDLGITYIDTAHSYGGGRSEERIGKLMGSRRKDIFLATKLIQRKNDDALRALELSMKRLQVDRLDLVHVHALSGEDDLKVIEGPGGVLEALYRTRDEGMTRFIGITCHATPAALKVALERHDFDCVQMALNAARARMDNVPGGMKAVAMSSGGFEEVALPVAERRGMGVIAMKIFGQEQLLGSVTVEELISYSLSLPVSAVSLGMPKREHIRQNVSIAHNFEPISQLQQDRIASQISKERTAALAEFLACHSDV
jgi:predicted aldo/keto reductase-like oxidoreductase